MTVAQPDPMRERVGDAANAPSLEHLVPLIYDELRALAARFLARERRGHTLQTTALAHEAYLRLATQRKLDTGDRTCFMALAARLIRRILADHGRRRGRIKRGGDLPGIAIDTDIADTRTTFDAVEVSDLLDRLADIDPLQARIVEMRVYAGLTFEEIGDALDVSTGKTHKEWRMARAWLLTQMERSE